MRSGHALGPGPILVKSANARHQANRRKLALAGGFVALAIASGVLGSLIRPAERATKATITDPFSYFPSE